MNNKQNLKIQPSIISLEELADSSPGLRLETNEPTSTKNLFNQEREEPMEFLSQRCDGNNQLLSNSPSNLEAPSEVVSQDVSLSISNAPTTARENPTGPPIEVRLYIIRCFGLFLANIMLSSSLLVIVNFKMSMYRLLNAFQCFLLYFLVENIIRIRMKNRETSRIREDIFIAIDCICGFCVTLSIQFEIKSMNLILVLCGAPFFLNGLIYAFMSQRTTGTKIINIMTRCFYGIQSVLMIAQVGGILDWDWYFAFGLTFVYLTYYIPFFIAFGVIFALFAVLFCFKKFVPSRINIKKQIFGLFWHMLFSSLSFSVFLMLSQALDACSEGKDMRILNKSCFIFLLTNIILSVITFPNFQSLSIFIHSVWNANLSDEEANNTNTSKFKITLSVDKTKSLFMMLSQTYFVPLQKGLLNNTNRIQNQQDVKTRRTPRPKRLTLDAKKISENLVEYKSIDLSPKLCVTVGNIDCAGSFSTENNTKQDEETCYLCYDRKPDAILMTCGHGGICYECATTLVQKKNECMECRNEVKYIVKVNPKLKNLNIIEGVEVTTVNKIISPNYNEKFEL